MNKWELVFVQISDGKTRQSPSRDHYERCGHCVTFDKFKIFDTGKEVVDLCILESILHYQMKTPSK